MLLVTKLGTLNPLQHPLDTSNLQISVQKQAAVDRLVAILDEIGGEHLEVQWICEGDCRFQIIARKEAVAEAIARLVAEIDYTE